MWAHQSSVYNYNRWKGTNEILKKSPVYQCTLIALSFVYYSIEKTCMHSNDIFWNIKRGFPQKQLKHGSNLFFSFDDGRTCRFLKTLKFSLSLSLSLLFRVHESFIGTRLPRVYSSVLYVFFLPPSVEFRPRRDPERYVGNMLDALSVVIQSSPIVRWQYPKSDIGKMAAHSGPALYYTLDNKDFCTFPYSIKV